MTSDRVKNGHAQLYCIECGAEVPIIQYVFRDPSEPESFIYDFPIISMSKTIESIQSFRAKHALCKNPSLDQTELFETVKEKI